MLDSTNVLIAMTAAVVNGTGSGPLEAMLEVLPENPLTNYFEAVWRWMTGNFSEFQIATFGSLIWHETWFVLLCLPHFLCQFVPCMQRFKIQTDKPETASKQWRCVKLLLFSHFCVQFPMIMGTYMYTEMMSIPFSWEKMPRWYELAWRVYFCALVEDTWHYWFHRLGHHPKLYRHVHKVHHHHQAPFGMAAEYAHPIETVVLGAGVFLPMLLVCNHVWFIWLWGVFRMMEAIDVHSGYDIPYTNPFHLLPGYAGVRFHDFHHHNFHGNYASTFVWWDRLGGTDQQWRQFCEKVKGVAGARIDGNYDKKKRM